MASYLVLGNYTDEGIRNIKDSPNRLAAVRQAVEGVGGRLIFFYLTMGQYDFVSLAELPNDEVPRQRCCSKWVDRAMRAPPP